MNEIMLTRLSEFFKYQWVFFLALYWGLRIVGEPELSQNVSFFAAFMLAVGIGWLVIGIISHDKGFIHVSQRIIRESSVNLIVVLMSEIMVILWIFVKLNNMEIDAMIEYLIMKYCWQIIPPTLCLIWEKKIRKKGVVTS
ncbi:hypothetical protein H6769_03205 [Candidatus Peribacteria bacterium]|nr:hypothetical protein [Candidatus Peribacteria bacterium]